MILDCLVPLLEIAEKLKDPSKTKSIIFDPSNRNPNPVFPRDWMGLSLAEGYPGFLLLFSNLEQLGFIDEKIPYQYVLAIKQMIETNGIPNLSLFGGLSGICFALKSASMNGTRYCRLLNTLNKYLLDRIDNEYLIPLKTNHEKNEGMFSNHYDIMHGVCGVGLYLLDNLSDHRCFEKAIHICQVLIQVCTPFMRNGYTIPGWYMPKTDILNLWIPEDHMGSFNLSLSHGISGILAFLSIAMLKGISVEGQKEIMGVIIKWLCDRSIQNKAMIQWPNEIPFQEEVGMQAFSQKAGRDAWCYGAPGISRALLLAGKALGEKKIIHFALEAFRGVFMRKKEDWHLPGPTLCHGIAGLLLITDAMAKEEDANDLSLKKEELYEMLLSFYDSSFLFGFKNVEKCADGSFIKLNNPSFLEGTSGILLTLLSLSYPELSWHAPFCIYTGVNSK